MTDTHDAGDDLLAILDELDSLVSTARAVPMSASVVVNRDDVLDMIDRARAAVPQAVRQAEQIVADADEVLAQGRAESEQLIARAHEEVERLVASENVVRQASDRADAIIAAAEEKAQRLRHGADDYSDRCLAALEIEVDRLAEQVRAGRRVLADRLGQDEPQAVDAGGEREPARGGRSGRARWSVDPAAQSDLA